MAMLIWIACLIAAVSQQRSPTEQITLLPNQDGKPSAVDLTEWLEEPSLSTRFGTRHA